jgi:hypothetical protein
MRSRDALGIVSAVAVVGLAATLVAVARSDPGHGAGAHPAEVGRSSKPAAGEGARPCGADDVQVDRRTGANGAGGHSLHILAFHNVGTRTCVLQGYPAVVASAPGLPDVVGTDGSFFPELGTADLAPGGIAYLGLEEDTYCAARPGGNGSGLRYTHVAITLAGGGTVPFDLPGPMDLACGLHLQAFSVPG